MRVSTAGLIVCLSDGVIAVSRCAAMPSETTDLNLFVGTSKENPDRLKTAARIITWEQLADGRIRLGNATVPVSVRPVDIRTIEVTVKAILKERQTVSPDGNRMAGTGVYPVWPGPAYSPVHSMGDAE